MAGNDVKEGGFAGAVGTYHHVTLAFADLHRDTCEHLKSGKSLEEVVYAQYCLHLTLSPSVLSGRNRSALEQA